MYWKISADLVDLITAHCTAVVAIVALASKYLKAMDASNGKQTLERK